MAKYATANQVSYINGMYQKLGLAKPERLQELSQFTGREIISTRYVFASEASELIPILKGLLGQINDPCDRMRKKILHLAHLMGWTLPTGKANIAQVNAWCIARSTLKKPLNDHSAQELPALVTQFEMVYNNYLKSM